MAHRLISAAIAAAGFITFIAQPAHAGLFDDDVARKQVAELQKSMSQMLIDQSRLIEQMNREVAELRGQTEVLVNQIGLLEKRQKDLYLDIDTRLQPIEASRLKTSTPTASIPTQKPTAPTVTEAKTANKVESTPVVIPQIPPAINAQPQTSPADSVAALKSYEAALDLFKAGKYKDAANAFDQFGQNFGTSEQAAAAQFWLGNSYAALGDCVQVIISQQNLLAKWPTSTRAPDAMLNIANCQAETGAKAESQKILRDLLTKYPDSKAAIAAKQQLK